MTDTGPILSIRGLCRKFPGQGRPALDGVTFAVARGDCIVLSGANGSGKSVLMHLIAGLDRPDSGSVELSNDPDGKPVRVGLVFQDASAQILGDTVLEDVAFGPQNLGFGREAVLVASLEALRRTGLADKQNFPSRTLSGGEKRRLAIAGILAMDPPVIIFDEPYANLDWPGVVQVNDIIDNLRTEGRTVLILTHELEKVLAMANRLLVLHEGRLVYDGDGETALAAAPLADWGIRNPLGEYRHARDLVWKGDGIRES